MDIPPADVIIHSGDMTSTGTMAQLTEFIDWFESLPHPNKVFVAGNHDITLDTAYYVKSGYQRFHARARAFKDGRTDPLVYSQQCREVFTSRTQSCYLEDSSIYLTTEIKAELETVSKTCAEEVGVETCSGEGQTVRSPSQVRLVPEAHTVVGKANIRIYGSPWQPEFCDWAFNLKRGPDSARVWSKIPLDTDVLVTHGPPQGQGDLTEDGFSCGCEELLAVVEGMETPPRVHVFGHIHEGYGHWTNGKTLFVNASTCNFDYRPTNRPILFFLPFDQSLPATIIEY